MASAAEVRELFTEKLSQMLRWNVWGMVSFEEKYDESGDRPTQFVRPDQHDPETANSMSSLMESSRMDYIRADKDNGREPYHKVVLDLDMDAVLIPSATEGHHHLIIQHTMPWSQYKELLEVLGKVGILEPGYVAAAIRREATWIRAPWALKGQPNKAEESAKPSLAGIDELEF